MNGVSRIKRAEGLATDDFTWDGENRLVAVSKATPGTPYAYQGSLTSNGQGAISVSSYSTYAGPALKVGQVVTLSGAPLVQLNGAHAITSVWGSGSFSYQVPGTQSGGPVGVLVTVDQLNQQKSYQFGYDYRSRRVNLTTPTAPFTRVVFSGGTSVREIENGVATVDYVRGSDWGGGVGGILYTLRAGVPSFTHYNRRGDVTAKTDGTGKITYQAKYEAFGKRTSETGATLDRQKSNTKDEDIPGYANEGFRLRDLETGVFLSKDPLGFVDGPNVYAYVVQNPWTKFDPEGLDAERITEGKHKGKYTLHMSETNTPGIDDFKKKNNLTNVNGRVSSEDLAKAKADMEQLLGKDRFYGPAQGDKGAQNKEECAAGAQGLTGTAREAQQKSQNAVSFYDAPKTSTWVQGDAVVGNFRLKPGTMIATFNEMGKYDSKAAGEGAGNHTGIYMGQDKNNIFILHQFEGHPMRLETIPIKKGGVSTGPAKPSDARNYSVVISSQEFDASSTMTPPVLRNK